MYFESVLERDHNKLHNKPRFWVEFDQNAKAFLLLHVSRTISDTISRHLEQYVHVDPKTDKPPVVDELDRLTANFEETIAAITSTGTAECPEVGYLLVCLQHMKTLNA